MRVLKTKYIVDWVSLKRGRGRWTGGSELTIVTATHLHTNFPDLPQEENRRDEIKKLTSAGKLPVSTDLENIEKAKGEVPADLLIESRALLMGQVAGAITNIPTAKEIVDDMVSGAVQVLSTVPKAVIAGPKL